MGQDKQTNVDVVQKPHPRFGGEHNTNKRRKIPTNYEQNKLWDRLTNNAQKAKHTIFPRRDRSRRRRACGPRWFAGSPNLNDRSTKQKRVRIAVTRTGNGRSSAKRNVEGIRIHDRMIMAEQDRCNSITQTFSQTNKSKQNHWHIHRPNETNVFSLHGISGGNTQPTQTKKNTMH